MPWHIFAFHNFASAYATTSAFKLRHLCVYIIGFARRRVSTCSGCNPIRGSSWGDLDGFRGQYVCIRRARCFHQRATLMHAWAHATHVCGWAGNKHHKSPRKSASEGDRSTQARADDVGTCLLGRLTRRHGRTLNRSLNMLRNAPGGL